MFRMKNLVAALLCSTFLAGCGGGGTSRPSNAQLSGNWHAILTSAVSSNPLGEDFFIVQNGGTLSSDNISLQGTCFPAGTMMGSVNGNQVNMILNSQNGDTVSITGTASGDTLSGSYTIKTSGCIGGDMGTLSATLIPSVQSAAWTGATVSTMYPPGHTTFTANLAEDNAGKVTGTMVFTGSTCSFLSTASVSGTQTGNILNIRDTAPDGVTLFGTLDSVAKNISGGYGISICSGDNGTFTMSHP
jgi:hypothetical protein